MTFNTRRAPIQNSLMDCDGEQSHQCEVSEISHSTYIYTTMMSELHSWNHSGKGNSIVVVDTTLWQYRLLVCTYPQEGVHLRI